MILPEYWVEARLGEVLSRADARIDPQTSNVERHFYIGLEDIEANTGRLLRDSSKFTTGSEILSIKTEFSAGDILYGKLRPNLNKVYLAKQPGICSTDIWALKPSERLLPEYAAYYLRSPMVLYRTARLAAGANLPRISADKFDSLTIPLPPLVEQKRIVEVLQQAESHDLLLNSRRARLDAVIKAQLDNLVLSCQKDDWQPLGGLVETRYGTSVSADSNPDDGIPVLRIPNVVGGEVDTSDLKYVELPAAELIRLSLTTDDVLVVRTNGNPEYVGRSAPISEENCVNELVFASYLIRVRVNPSYLLSEYLSAFLNSSFGRAAMRSAIRTTAGQSNLSAEGLAKVRLPVPNIEAQEHFKKFWLQAKLIRSLINRSEIQINQLRAGLGIFAMSGEYTKRWRYENLSVLDASKIPSEKVLDKRNDEVSHSSADTTPAGNEDSLNPLRSWLVSELSEFQRQVLHAFKFYCHKNRDALIVEDPDVFLRFCEDSELMDGKRPFGASYGNRVRRSLSQLAGLGLIVKVTLPKIDIKTGERDYLKAFRLLRPEEQKRFGDVQALKKIVYAQENTPKYYFEVQLDHDASDRAGAAGMFQVICLKDGQDRDVTHLIDSGSHYQSLHEVKGDIAKALNISVPQIDLETI